MNQIVNDFGKGFKQLGVETVEKLVQETGKIAESVITAGELLNDIKPMSDNELNQKKNEDERKKQEELARLRQGYGGQGRNVDSEVKQISDQKKKEEDEKEKIFLENLRRQREEERRQQENNGMDLMGSKKHHKDKGGNKHKTQQPDETQMSQTAEYKGKID